MKLYLLNGTYYEKQADVPKGQGKFETVEFPFAASPKADFVAWLNERPVSGDGMITDDGLLDLHGEMRQEALPVDRHVRQVADRKPIGQPAQPRPFPDTVDGVVRWVMDDASKHEVMQVFNGLAARFSEEAGA